MRLDGTRVELVMIVAAAKTSVIVDHAQLVQSLEPQCHGLEIVRMDDVVFVEQLVEVPHHLWLTHPADRDRGNCRSVPPPLGNEPHHQL
jgi:dihydroorotase-like cyclic amidohydrolase